MKIKILIITNILFLILSSCAGQSSALFVSVPDFTVYENEKIIDTNNIIETKDGVILRLIPEWLFTYLEGGVRAVEALEAFNDKFVFIAVNDGENFVVLNKWAENFSAEQDFAVLAATRIENRMIQGATLFPDDEYGSFFEILVKNSFKAEYRNVVKEDTYWIKLIADNDSNGMRNSSSETYYFFVLLTVNRSAMQNSIRNMMTQANSEASMTNSQAASVNRLRQTFFIGF